MTTFLVAWGISFVALGLAVLILSIAYRLFGSDFGTEGWIKELVIVLFTSALHAGVVVAVMHFHETPNHYSFKAMYALAQIATYMVYKITHLEDMTDFELGILVATNFATFVGMWFFAAILLN